MALGKYTRVDGKKPSPNYCSIVTIVAFIVMCLVGLWMTTSVSVVPVQNMGLPSRETRNGSFTQVSSPNEDNRGSNRNYAASNKNNSSTDVAKPKQLDDVPSDLPEISSKGDTVTQKESTPSSREPEKPPEEIQDMETEEKTSIENSKEPKTLKTEKKENKENGELITREKDNEAGESSESKSAEKGAHLDLSNAERKKEISAKGIYGKIDESVEDEMDPDGEQSKNKPIQEGENREGSDLIKPDEGDAKKKPRKTSGEANDDYKIGKVGDRNDFEGLGKKMEHSDDNFPSVAQDDLLNKTLTQNGNDEGDAEKKPIKNSGEANDNYKIGKVGDKKDFEGLGKKMEDSDDNFPSVAQDDLLNKTFTQNGPFSNQAAESINAKEAPRYSESDTESAYKWKLCNVTAGPDFIPCLDNLEAIKSLKSTKHYEHRERHCPVDRPTCLVPHPEGYQPPIKWPTSRDKIWYHNVPHTKLAKFKRSQNWVKVIGEYLTFPGGGTQFKRGALHYIDFIQQSVPEIAWGTRSRVILDVGCGVASFGGYLFEKDVLAMSLAPKDEHEAQVQFALERGIPAISAVMGTKRLPFPGGVFDIVHCARCRVPWHIEGGKLLLELNRLLRPGGYFVWSATPVYLKLPEDVEIWEAMMKLTNSMCWELLAKNKDRVNRIGVAIFQKPISNECYEQRSQDDPPLCEESDDPDAAWNVPLQSCMHKVPTALHERGSQWPEAWPARLEKSPYWLLSSQTGVYGKPAPDDFVLDYQHWKRVVTKSYLNGLGFDWSSVRNVMDMRAIYGGFAAALRELNVWVMNIVSIDAPDTLPIIYERGLFGMYHDWCESFSTYPRSYDLLHADHLFSKIKTKWVPTKQQQISYLIGALDLGVT
ncbi:hypothetical protein DM860_011074 [Cuscuta australis]|uniref:Methyltransferase n=1 Tax=Cuscuta australis TaxID=267555 RepID=A0A328E0R5_9ASTE|nr:hypothetical protein DM860_011074 [Cuscuta australis]